MITITPNNVASFPGARLVFSVQLDGQPLELSTLPDARVEVYFPESSQQMATIHETDNTFSWVVPIQTGEHDVRVLISWNQGDEWGTFTIKINPVLAARFTYQTAPDIDATGTVHADIYNPLGQLVFSSQMTFNGYTYELTHRPSSDWFEGEYKIAVRDDTGVLDVDSLWIERPSFASMKQYFELPDWQRQIIEYIKYEMMGDTDPLHPGALFTLEEYTKHWRNVAGEINNVPWYTEFQAPSIPVGWANVMMKGTLLRVYQSLANRGVVIPRWQNLNAPIQDESHYQQSWESRYQELRPEYVEERAYMKGQYHAPSPAITVDPFLGFIGGSMAGTTGLAMIGRPSWFSGTWSGK